MGVYAYRLSGTGRSAKAQAATNGLYGGRIFRNVCLPSSFILFGEPLLPLKEFNTSFQLIMRSKSDLQLDLPVSEFAPRPLFLTMLSDTTQLF